MGFASLYPSYALSQRVRPEVAGPMTGSAKPTPFDRVGTLRFANPTRCALIGLLRESMDQPRSLSV
jgi:hypothetical protein